MRIWVYCVAILLASLVLYLLRGAGLLAYLFATSWMCLFAGILGILHRAARQDANDPRTGGELRYPTAWGCSTIVVAGLASAILAFLTVPILLVIFSTFHPGP